ncbi:hypothetical protein HY570_04415, partial [Candidatus Micrarchaeota archaeon]|nr:hypothetical protein [Candidatus Micrarchaeota archaeon]
LCGSLKEALDELKSDSNFLKGIFSNDIIEEYSALKEKEFIENSMRPTPYEFKLYLNA